MKILIVNTSDIDGGAARATYRIHKSLLSAGIDSKMLVIDKKSDDYTVIGPRSKKEKLIIKIRMLLDSFLIRFYKNRTKTLFSTSYLPFSNIVDKINEINPDIVHLHWICRSMINITDLSKIEAPIIWGLLDMWAFTGGCHYDEYCGEYKNNCGKCKVLGSLKKNDLSRFIYNKKKLVFSQLPNMKIVGHSKWLANSAKESSLFENNEVFNIPSAIDTNIFKPFSKKECLKLWGLPANKKLVLFGAMAATSDPRKGFKELSEALNKLQDKNIEFVVFGSSKPQNAPDLDFKTHYLGHLHDDISLVTLYSAVDVMIVPSLQENLSNAIMESLSCGTPVVAFDIGGNSDMIEHQNTGYLAKPFDTTDLKDGIEWVLNSSNYEELCVNAREKVLKEFDSVVVAKRYMELYEEMIK
ncbi:MAG: glycosyltransferase family 4 protein [Aliarcobacter butzleri]|nr:glycosyltransferase family 4 protein [Aliarcobacter butzleri]